MKSLQNMEISSLGWQNASWQPEFYPEDLPNDWFFDFYLNHFRLACVSSNEWQTWLADDCIDEEAFEDFADCINEHNFLLLVAEESELEDLNQVLSLVKEREIGESIIGVAIKSEETLPPPSIAGYPVSLISSKLQFSGWHWQNDEISVSGQPLCWIESLPAEGRAQSALLVDFMQSLPQPIAVPVCIADSGAEISLVNNLKTVAELLGY